MNNDEDSPGFCCGATLDDAVHKHSHFVDAFMIYKYGVKKPSSFTSHNPIISPKMVGSCAHNDL